MRLELLREETRKAALHALIEEIVAYAMIEVKYRIRNRYRTVSKAVEGGQYPVYVPPQRYKPRQLQFTPILQLGNTLQLESETKAAQPIHAGLN